MTFIAAVLTAVLPAFWPQELADRLVWSEAADATERDSPVSLPCERPVLRAKTVERDDVKFDLSRPLTISVWFRYPRAEGAQKYLYLIGVNGDRLAATGKFPLNNLQANVVPVGFKAKGFAGYFQSYNLPENSDVNWFVTKDFARDYPPDEWHHAAMVSLPTKTDYYLDGRPVGSVVHRTPIRPEWKIHRLRLGCPNLALADVCVFDAALTPEIIANYFADMKSYLISLHGTYSGETIR